MNIRHLVFALTASLAACVAHAQFVPGQVLTASQLNAAFANVMPRSGGTLTGPLTVPSLTSTGAVTVQSLNLTGGPMPVASGGTGTSSATGSGSVVLSASPVVTGTASNPFVVSGLQSVMDSGRAANDNTPTVNISATEALNYTPLYATHYALIVNAHQTGGTGDRIGVGSYQTCDATLAGKSCVGGSDVAVAGGTAVGNYTGSNPRALVPVGLTGPIGAAVAMEADIETHSPVLIRNGLRIADENQSGGTVTHGTLEDAAIAIVTDTTEGNPGFKVGIQFGENEQGYPQYWPILAGGRLMTASNPGVQLAYGLDFTGATGGFSGAAIGLPLNTAGAGIAWGSTGAGGSITSTATAGAGGIAFTNNGTTITNSSGGPILNVGGATGADMINSGYLTEASLTGYVYCNGASARCTASTSVGLAGTSSSIGGSALAAGACASGTVTVTGATTSMVAQASPVTYPGDGNVWSAYVSGANTVTIKVCAVVAGTPTASTYNVRVLQ
ncbi:hypothetical protein [Burkholderia gladioli]|uniref:hypothetical protein n=1 Tax=Burkholderia gladioli TaxID=28095 RepID=UPI0016414DCF|nr:hypothetical protein [Burkholderia gladioli]